MLFVGQWRGYLTHRVEVVWLDIATVHRLENLGNLLLTRETNHFELIVVMVEDDNHLIHDVKDIGSIVLGLCLVFDGNILEIAHSIERGIAIETTCLGIVARDMEAVDEGVDGFGRTEISR